MYKCLSRLFATLLLIVPLAKQIIWPRPVVSMTALPKGKNNEKMTINLGYNCNQLNLKGIIIGFLHFSHCICAFNYYIFKKQGTTHNMGLVYAKKMCDLPLKYTFF